MPNVVLSSKLRPYDSIFLQEWIHSAVQRHYIRNKSKRFWHPEQNLVAPLPQTQEHSFFHAAFHPGSYTFVRIVKFHKVHNYTVYATIRDASHMILCFFTSQCVLDYEMHNNDRITLNTINTLFVVGQVTLEFWNQAEVQRHYGLSFPNMPMVPILKIEQAQIFDRDQIGSTKPFNWVYYAF
ncbi:telomere replication protein EST3 [Kluyveromyces marxianus DMKU3-1042]|uniref:Telomere replication protein EST3 n=1 Tax=Kluyveromyces marxianus (strain DMKU3-1042 / BCC 29191 / NBRC 104275) TaxID=1003335 RepID=W0TBN3_KLUMD|nr:telomere replication protein EST3 [Kluyveromyces marxianus DMKU3-1042]BAO41057.1 telomere replication protein EST3 [Kluyveromyces marxianus DMKU3-1042]